MRFHRFPLNQQYVFMINFNTLLEGMTDITVNGTDVLTSYFKICFKLIFQSGFDVEDCNFQYHISLLLTKLSKNWQNILKLTNQLSYPVGNTYLIIVPCHNFHHFADVFGHTSVQNRG